HELSCSRVHWFAVTLEGRLPAHTERVADGLPGGSARTRLLHDGTCDVVGGGLDAHGTRDRALPAVDARQDARGEERVSLTPQHTDRFRHFFLHASTLDDVVNMPCIRQCGLDRRFSGRGSLPAQVALYSVRAWHEVSSLRISWTGTGTR